MAAPVLAVLAQTTGTPGCELTPKMFFREAVGWVHKTTRDSLRFVRYPFPSDSFSRMETVLFESDDNASLWGSCGFVVVCCGLRSVVAVFLLAGHAGNGSHLLVVKKSFPHGTKTLSPDLG